MRGNKNLSSSGTLWNMLLTSQDLIMGFSQLKINTTIWCHVNEKAPEGLPHLVWTSAPTTVLSADSISSAFHRWGLAPSWWGLILLGGTIFMEESMEKQRPPWMVAWHRDCRTGSPTQILYCNHITYEEACRNFILKTSLWPLAIWNRNLVCVCVWGGKLSHCCMNIFQVLCLVPLEEQADTGTNPMTSSSSETVNVPQQQTSRFEKISSALSRVFSRTSATINPNNPEAAKEKPATDKAWDQKVYFTYQTE